MNGVAALLAVSLSVGAEPLPAPTVERLDALGRPEPWGPPVAGFRIGAFTPRGRQLLGQPIELWLTGKEAGERESPLPLVWDGPGRTLTVEWTDDRGAPVPHEVEPWWQGERERVSLVRLVPTNRLEPGSYRLRVVADVPRAVGDPRRWVGRLVSNVCELEVVERPGDPPEAAAALRDLDDARFIVR